MKLNIPAAIGVAGRYRQVGTELGWKESKRLRIDLKFKIKNITSPDMFYFSYQYDEHHRVSFCTDTVYTSLGQDSPSRTSNVGMPIFSTAGRKSR